MDHYSEAFWITGKQGNNALSYDRRGPDPRLYVPSLVEGDLDLLHVGEQVVFEDFDEQDQLQSCPGLRYLVRMEWKGVPMVVVDNHNHALYFWAEALLDGRLQAPAALVHIDQHKDMRTPERLFKGVDLKDVFQYVNWELNVGNYIVPAREAGWVGEIQFVTSAAALEDRSFIEKENKILNIDLDFFAPELDYIEFEKTRAFIRAQLAGARLITVATSPFFIDQKRAIQKLRELMED